MTKKLLIGALVGFILYIGCYVFFPMCKYENRQTNPSQTQVGSKSIADQGKAK